MSAYETDYTCGNVIGWIATLIVTQAAIFFYISFEAVPDITAPWSFLFIAGIPIIFFATTTTFASRTWMTSSKGQKFFFVLRANLLMTLPGLFIWWPGLNQDLNNWVLVPAFLLGSSILAISATSNVIKPGTKRLLVALMYLCLPGSAITIEVLGRAGMSYPWTAGLSMLWIILLLLLSFLDHETQEDRKLDVLPTA